MPTPSAVRDVQLWMQEVGLVDGSTDWPSVERLLHDESERLVVLTDDGGREPELPAAAGLGSAAIGDAGVEIIVRGEAEGPEETQEKAQEILDALHGQFNVGMGYGSYLRVKSLTSQPAFIGYDERRRPVFRVAVRLARRVNVPSV